MVVLVNVAGVADVVAAAVPKRPLAGVAAGVDVLGGAGFAPNSALAVVPEVAAPPGWVAGA